MKWEAALKLQLHKWMADPTSPFHNVQSNLEASSNPKTDIKNTVKSTFSMLVDLHSRGALPAIVFDYDQMECEKILTDGLETLQNAEKEYRDTNPEWKKKLVSYERHNAQKARYQAKASKTTGSRRDDKDDGTTLGKMDHLREDANQEASPWASFDPNAPIDQFSFAGSTKISKEELEKLIVSLTYVNIQQHFLDALRRGLAVHHAGMNRKYRQV